MAKKKNNSATENFTKDNISRDLNGNELSESDLKKVTGGAGPVTYYDPQLKEMIKQAASKRC